MARRNIKAPRTIKSHVLVTYTEEERTTAASGCGSGEAAKRAPTLAEMHKERCAEWARSSAILHLVLDYGRVIWIKRSSRIVRYGGSGT